jgi:hypothetical protein
MGKDRRPLHVLLLVFWGGLTVTFLAMAVVYALGGDPEHGTDGAIGSMVFAAVTGALAAHRVMHLRVRKPPAAPAAVEPAYRLPGPASAALEPMRGLAEAESALAELLGQLDQADWVDGARQSAATAAAELRMLANKLVAVESALEHAPQADHPELSAGVRRLREWLDKGLDAYRGVVGAAGRMLVASAPAPAVDELTEATDRLASIARALTELGDLRQSPPS